jgi:hypothetical protein
MIRIRVGSGLALMEMRMRRKVSWPLLIASDVGKIWERTQNLKMPAKSHRINEPYAQLRAHNPKVVSSNLTPATNLGFTGRAHAPGLFVFVELRNRKEDRAPRDPRTKRRNLGHPALLAQARLRVLNGLDDGRSIEISMVCELLGQRAVDE